MNRKTIIDAIRNETISETLNKCELKSTWKKDHGRDISAMANNLLDAKKWLVVGVRDSGESAGLSHKKAKALEEQISQQVLSHLAPVPAVKDLSCEEIGDSFYILIEIENPGDVTYWDDRAYHAVGTVSMEMTPAEIMDLSTRLPGLDFSKQKSEEPLDPALIVGYAQYVEKSHPEFGLDATRMSPMDILGKLNIRDTIAASILFGSFSVRVVRYDENGLILSQASKKGLFGVLHDDFLEEIQSWTRKQSPELGANSISTAGETPYPLLALREVLANAVAHSVYSRDKGNLVIELSPSRLAVSNNSPLESKAFVNHWFSNRNHSHNKLLMNALRMAKISDELGTGKMKIFRLMIEGGKPEPVIEFEEYGKTARWKIVLYNHKSESAMLNVISKLKEKFYIPDEWRIAAALVLWRDKTWSEILATLDGHYQRIADKILQSSNSPVIVHEDSVYPKWWVKLALEGVGSRSFTSSEENQMKVVLAEYSHSENRGGYIDNSEARAIWGLSTDRTEVTQLSKLFTKWQKQSIVKNIGKGKWKFI